MRINLFYVLMMFIVFTVLLSATLHFRSHASNTDLASAPAIEAIVPREDVILGTSSGVVLPPVSEESMEDTPVLTKQEVVSKKVPPPDPVIKSRDITSPTQPLSLVATTTDTRASISWLASKDNIAVVGYKVFRNGIEVGTTPFLKYSQINLLPETFYTFEVSEYDKAGNVSPVSAAAKVKTLSKITVTPAVESNQPLPPIPVDSTPLPTPQPDTTAPTIPSNVIANTYSTSEIVLAWNPSTDTVGVLGYNIFRNGAFVTTVSETTYVDIGLSPDTSYVYTISAYDAAGNTSERSVSKVGTTLATPLPTLEPAPVTNPVPAPTPTPTPSQTPTGTPTTYTVSVTSSGVISPSSVTLAIGDSIKWVYVAPINDEIVLRFTPTPPTSLKLDHDTTTRTYTFSAAGTWSYRAGGAYATIIVQ